jgi:pyruvate dehydrogenase E2 component (dihydrolipoamide acetyltransferase)
LKEPGLYHATPSVRLLARELGADLAFVRGTGPKGRIRREDLSAYVKEKLAAPGRGAAGSGAPGREKPAPLDPETFRKFGGIEIVAASRIKRISGPRLAESWRTIPHVTQFDEADITELEEFRNRSKALLAKEDLKLTVLAFAIKAAVATLKAFPVFNSSLLPESGEFVMKKYYNIGFAVSTEAGLLVPCLKNADAKSLREIARELKELSTKASTRKLGFEDMSGASFTISSLGGIGGTGFTPIVNPPEVAILGLSRASMKPLWNEKTASFLPRLVLPFSLSYDHRAIDGAEGARFCRHFASLMGDMAALLM